MPNFDKKNNSAYNGLNSVVHFDPLIHSESFRIIRLHQGYIFSFKISNLGVHNFTEAAIYWKGQKLREVVRVEHRRLTQHFLIIVTLIACRTCRWMSTMYGQAVAKVH